MTVARIGGCVLLSGVFPPITTPFYPDGTVYFKKLEHNVDQYCRTPSAELLQHEWQAHGACAWPNAAAYFADSARLFDHVVLPKVEAIPTGAHHRCRGGGRDRGQHAERHLIIDGAVLQVDSDAVEPLVRH